MQPAHLAPRLVVFRDQLLGVQANRVPMVMSQVAKLLNVEGYPVVSADPATQAVTLDAALLAEQYGVHA